MEAIDTADGFVSALMAVERAWAMLDRGEARAALATAPHSAQVAVRAAALLPSEEGRAILEAGLALDGAPAPLQLALARALDRAGETDGARRRFRAALLRARPDGSLLVELAALEAAGGDGGAAAVMLAAAYAVPARDHDAICRAAGRLDDLGRPDLALAAFALAHRRGNRAPALFADWGAVLARRPDPAALAGLPGVDAVRADPALANAARHIATHAALSLGPDRAALLDHAARREASPGWVGRADLPGLLRRVITACRPFAFVRLGDGEARFLLGHDPALADLVPGAAARAEADGIWRIWFGAPLADAPAGRVATLAADLRAAAADADMLGVASHLRLSHDHYHYPYCALIERFVATLPSSPRLLTSADHAADLAEDDPLLASTLGGLDFIGFVGPHADLAPRLAARLGIGASRTWLVPGETRLGRTGEGLHFPDAFDRTMADLAVPRPGAVMLVAAGLLGKLYAARIRALGGIALDIGAVADAWMGINSRGTALDRLMGQALPPV